MDELWEDIPGYEWLYKISNFGRVKKIISGEEILHIFWENSIWYLYIGLKKNNIYCVKAIHRMVAILFVSNPNNYPIVNHIDWNKSNARYSNLEWCTQKYNMWHSRNILWNKVGTHWYTPKISLIWMIWKRYHI